MSPGRDELDRLVEPDWQSSLPPVCPQCQYNLTGLTSNRCPECGRIFLKAELKRNAAEMRVWVHEFRELNHWIKVGVGVALLGVALAAGGLALTLAAGGWASAVGRILGGLCGLPAVFLGLSPLRALRVPAWCREALDVDVNYPLAGVSAALGVGLIVWGLFSPW